MAAGAVDGLIVTAEHISEQLLPTLIETRIPFVYIGRPQIPEHVSFVDVDNEAGAYQAVSHLLRQGYRRIAHIAGPHGLTASANRRAGYVAALSEQDVSVDESLIVEGGFSQESGYAAMQQLIPARPDAVFAASDTMGLGALHALQAADRCVPDDVALVSFDDLAPATMANPPLTTVRQPVVRSGSLAVETLIDLLDTGLEPPRHIFLPTELVIRDTCGARRR